MQLWFDQALIYQAQINQALKLAPHKSTPLDSSQLAAQVNAWIEVIQDLVQRLALLRGNDLIRRELAAVPQGIEALETQLAGSSDVALRIHLERALAYRRNQLALLKELQHTMRQAELQIENTLALLSTVYSQILTGQSVSHVANYGHFLVNIDEEVCRLQDQLEALREVKQDQLFHPLSFRTANT